MFRFLPKRKPVDNSLRFQKGSVNRASIRANSSSASKKFRRKVVKRKFLRSALLIILIVLGVALLITAGYFSINYAIGLRADTGSESVLAERSFVMGFDDVPSFPGSQFIFESYSNNETVRQFLSNGNSVYRLPPSASIDEISAFYSAELPKNGWELVNSVPLESEEMMPGDYWVKEEKGVRIYSKFNDIWYESVSLKQANNGLKDEVKKETERKLLLLSSEFSDLLPDFPWRLKVPSDFLASYSGTELTDLQSVSFKQIGHSNIVVLEPIGYMGAMPYDSFLDSYLSKKNKEEKTGWKVINSVVTTVSSQEAIKATITDGEKIGQSIVVGNPRNSVAYTLTTYEEEDPFFDYVIENLVPAKSSY